MPQSSRIYFMGLAKQAAKGTAETTPAYGLGLLSGNVFGEGVSQVVDDMTSTNRMNSNARREGVTWRANAETRLWPASSGLLLYAALGGISTTGSTNYTHTITPASTIPRLTVFGRGDALYGKYRDAKVDELTIAWDGTAPPTVSMNIPGGVMSGIGTTWTATTDETADEFLPTAGGTFKVDVDSATAVVAPITGGSVTIRNNVEPITLSTAIEPDDMWETVQEIEVSLTLKPDNLNTWREAVTGTSGGTAVQVTPVYGSFDVLFTESANVSVQLAATRVAFLADFPDANPDGSAMEVVLEGTVLKPAGAALTATVKNQVATY